MKKILALLMSVAFAPAAWAQAADWQKQWDATLAAAKKEGKVVVVGSPDPVMRNDLIPKFTKQYGIQVEYLTGSSSQLAGRIQTERQTGIYSIDVYLSGAGTTVPVHNVDGLARAIVDFANRRHELAALGERASDCYRAHFTPDRMAAEYLALYRACLQGGAVA